MPLAEVMATSSASRIGSPLQVIAARAVQLDPAQARRLLRLRNDTRGIQNLYVGPGAGRYLRKMTFHLQTRRNRGQLLYEPVRKVHCHDDPDALTGHP